MSLRPPSGPGERGSILYASTPVTDRTNPYEIIGVRRDASLAEIRISYRRSTQILAPERFANANDTVRAEAARRLSALNGAMEAIEAERAAEGGSALGSLTFGGPAVSPAAEPSMRSIAIVDEPPPLAPPAEDGEADDPADEVAVDAPEVEVIPLPEPEESTAPVDLGESTAPVEDESPDGEAEAEPTPTEEVPAAREADTEGDLLPASPGEETGEVPLIDLEPAPIAAPAEAPQRFERPPREPKRERSLVPRILAALAVVAALAAVGVYFLLGSGSTKVAGGQFQAAGAPVSFGYPSDLVARKPPSGGLLKPTFSTAVGVDAANYVVVATYKISADVQPDGSAIGSGGSRLTADRFDQSVDRAAERIAAAQKLAAKGPAQPGKAGDLIARIYDYTRPGGSSARYAFAFRGHTEYSIACFWDPAHAVPMNAACTQVMTTLQREVP
ncbi:MAG: hypothetical protein QOD65_121 [Gaiellales bacterium]|jgi:hypothetical protein|nr:hypothetical protein [Gaiellales bacterium]